MYYTQGKTQVYSPFGSFVVEQLAPAFGDERRAA